MVVVVTVVTVVSVAVMVLNGRTRPRAESRSVSAYVELAFTF